MHTIDPNEAVRLIRAKAVKFAYSEDDDPKTFVHAVMTQIGAVVDQIGDGSAAYLDAVGGQVKLMIAGFEADEPALPHKHESHSCSDGCGSFVRWRSSSMPSARSAELACIMRKDRAFRTPVL